MQNINPTYKSRKEFLKSFTDKYPVLETGLLGRSILSRDIDYYKIGNGKESVVVVGAHHGMEHITVSALFDFIEYISEKLIHGGTYHRIDVKFLLQKFTFWIVPCLNPDGVELCLSGLSENPLCERQLKMNGGSDFSSWQANARGVDLNHNYDYRFAEYKAKEAVDGVIAGRSGYSGEYSESEPETKSLANLIRTLMPRLVISLHTQGKEIYSMPKTDYMNRLSKRIADDLGYKYTVPEGSAAYGGLCDYTGGVLGIPSFTVELGSGVNPLPVTQLDAIIKDVRRILIMLPTRL